VDFEFENPAAFWENKRRRLPLAIMSAHSPAEIGSDSELMLVEPLKA
jgi:hypothetical protein